MWLTLLKKYWMHGVAVLLFGLYSWWLLGVGASQAEAECATNALAVEKANRKALEEWQERAYKADEKLRKKLEEPPASPRIVEVVRENPSSCTVPAPVFDSLQESINDANKALSQ